MQNAYYLNHKSQTTDDSSTCTVVHHVCTVLFNYADARSAGYHWLQYHCTSDSNPSPLVMYVSHVSQYLHLSLNRFYTGSNMCELLPQYTMHLLLTGSCKVLTHYRESVCINMYPYICTSASYVAVLHCGTPNSQYVSFTYSHTKGKKEQVCPMLCTGVVGV